MKIAKKLLKGFNDSLTVLIVIGIIITVNFLSFHNSFRFDLTDNGDYSVSDVTKRVAGELDDVVTIKTYFSRNLPAKYLNLEQEIEDMLAEYASYSNGRIRVESIDPEKLENAAQELGNKGIPTLQFNVLKSDEFKVVNGYLGLAVEYGTDSQVIPVIDSTKTLEYELTMAIKKLTAGSLPTLGVVVSHGAADPQKMTQAYGRLKQLYEIKSIDLGAEEAIGGDVSALLLIGLNQKLGDGELKKIDAFVMKGKPVIFLIDGVLVNPQTGATKNKLGLEKLLAAYGADVRNDLIADVSNGRASFSAPAASYYLTYQINYPLWPKVLPENMDSDNVMVAGLSSLILPWASSLELHPADGREIKVLARSTDKAISQVDDYNLEPDGAFISGAEAKQYDLAALISGKIQSPMGQGETDGAKIIVIGDSDFVIDSFSGPVSDNLVFFQNLADGLALDADLINIRSKGTVERPVKPIDAGTKELVRYLNILGISVLALIFGFIRYFLRRRNRALKVEAAGLVRNNPFLKVWIIVKGVFSGLPRVISSLPEIVRKKVAGGPEKEQPSPVDSDSAKDESSLAVKDAAEESYKDMKN
jgi:ABC-type uncharacterized transport system involved in gliding motility auxiliary subunit